MIDLPGFEEPTLDPVGVNPSYVGLTTPSPMNLAPYLTAFGGGMTAFSQLSAGNQSAALLRANAAIAGLQGRNAQQVGSEQAELYRQHLTQRLAMQGAAVGGSGVTASGSALRGLESTAFLGAQDIARIRTNAARRAWGFDVTQQGDLARAQMAGKQGEMGALGSLITSGARAYGQWSTD